MAHVLDPLHVLETEKLAARRPQRFEHHFVALQRMQRGFEVLRQDADAVLLEITLRHLVEVGIAGFARVQTVFDAIEPRRKRRISRERDPIEARLDLHGLNSIAAEARLKAFVQQAYANDYLAVLVITGKGMAENGVLKRHAPEWLSDPALGHIVAGISQAHARHGGTGALYVALKRRT